MVFTTLRVFSGAKRIPLIKFRKGGNLIAASGGAPGTATQASGSLKPAASKTNAAASSGTAIEDWELPARYWRKPIDKVEEEYINRGGPA